MPSTSFRKAAVLFIVFALCGSFCYAATVQDAIRGLKRSGVKGGLVVHVGCGDGKATAALYANDSFLVHGLDTDAETIEAARTHIKSLGIYGKVSAEIFGGKTLPYTDNIVNLLIVEDIVNLSQDEIMRVVAPGGVAMVNKGGWRKVTKPRPGNIDEWTHYLHDATNNAVADDELVGPPTAMQWVTKPLWLRSHETDSGISACVSAKGRIFYIFDEGLIGITDERLPERWSLIARDAFNGVLLWKKEIPKWGWTEWKYEELAGKDWTTLRGQRGNIPKTLTRRLVADGDKVFTTLSYEAPLSIIDAATGKVLHTVKGTEGTDEILYSDGIVLLRIKDLAQEGAERRGEPVEASFAAIDAATGKLLWKKQEASVNILSSAIEDGKLYFYSRNEMVCIDIKTGDDIWRVSSQPDKAVSKKAAGKTLLAQAGTLVVYKGTILLNGAKSIEAFHAKTGKQLWRIEVPSEAGAASADLYVIDDIVWRGIRGIGYDIKTGEVAKQVSIENLHSEGHHHRCYRGKATSNYIMTAKEGIEFINIDGGDNSRNNWLRGVCQYGIMPSNGLLYVPSDQCFCEPGSKLLGFNSLSSADVPKEKYMSKKANPLEKGPAYKKIARISSMMSSSQDWPTYRHDRDRSGSAFTEISGKVKPLWKKKIGTRLTQPVTADGKVFIADIDTHTVYALSGKNGKHLWQFTAGGRIDSPPTIYKSGVLFGSADGWVYCLRASDGALAWRLRAAPADRRIGAFSQLESAWPVHGSVLIQNDIAYVTAGRSSFLDGGIYVYAIEPATGKVLHKANVYGPDPDLSEGPGRCFWVEGARSEVLVGDGDRVYMRQVQFDNKLNRIENPVLSIMGDQKVGRHLFSTSSLLDEEWYNRAFWSYSEQWAGFYLSNQGPKSGQLIVFDERCTYSMKPYTRRNCHTPMYFPQTTGYLLYADDNNTEPQLVGQQGSKEPVEWLPESDYITKTKIHITAVAFDKDKGVGFTRSESEKWQQWIPIRIRAMVKANDTIFVMGPPDVLEEADPYAAFEGRKGAILRAVSAKDGKTLSELNLDTPPTHDGMIAANGKLFVSLKDGSLLCLDD